MARVTSDERRRVAERLRRLNAPSLIALMSILGVGGRDMCARLADLIEPDAASDTTKCDREALLALAAGLEADADRIIKAAKNARFTGFGPRMGEAKLDASEWRSIARRIREACGVVG